MRECTVMSWGLLIATVGCASLRPTLPAPEAGLQREMVTPRSTRCSLRCTTSFDVGSTRVEVQHSARTMSPEEATGRPRARIARRAGDAIGGSVQRALGGATSTLTVGRGTRNASIAAAPSAMRCDVVWIDEETTYREDGQDVTEVARLSQGLECIAVATSDTTQARWRVRAGISPVADSLRTVFDLVNYPEDFDGGDITLDRIIGGTETPYSVSARDVTITGIVDIPATRWTFRRRDGTPIGAVLRPRLAGAPSDPSDRAPGDSGAVDIAPAADDDERALLRMLGAVLGEHFRSTQ